MKTDPIKTMQTLQNKYDEKYPVESGYSVIAGFYSWDPIINIRVYKIPSMEVIQDLDFDYYGMPLTKPAESLRNR